MHTELTYIFFWKFQQITKKKQSRFPLLWGKTRKLDGEHFHLMAQKVRNFILNLNVLNKKV